MNTSEQLSNLSADCLKKVFEAIAKPFKGKTGEELYDKAAKVTSNTMGVGAGAAGAYDAATKDSKKTVNPETTESTEAVDSVMMILIMMN